MDRRNFLAFSALGTASIITSKALAQHDHHNHAKSSSKSYSKSESMLIKTAEDCIHEGKICLAHCLDSMSSGDKTLAACQQSVVNMLASVEAMNDVAIYGNYKKKSMIKLVDACQSFCEDCREECLKHSKHHKTCKACADACGACIEACKKFKAAI